MRKYTTQELKFQLNKLGYTWFDFHLIGIRSKANEKNKFDDVLYLVEKNVLFNTTCTTNPGTTWLKKLLNPKGAALLKPGQYIDTWQLDLHQGKYEALCQRKPVTVFRDADLDDIAEETKVTDTGLFGINIHRANPSAISSLINDWSAGCQVINNPLDFNFILKRCKESKLKNFTYTLINEF